jgi:hypothetical protein
MGRHSDARDVAFAARRPAPYGLALNRTAPADTFSQDTYGVEQTVCDHGKWAPFAYSGGGEMTLPHKRADPWCPQALPVRNFKETVRRADVYLPWDRTCSITRATKPKSDAPSIWRKNTQWRLWI